MALAGATILSLQAFAGAASISELQQEEAQAQAQLNQDRNAYQQSQANINAILAELAQLRQSWQNAEATVGSAQAQLKSTQAQIAQVQSLIAQNQAQMHALEAQIQTTTAQYQRTEAQIAQTQQKLQYEAGLLSGQLRLIEERGTLGYVDVLLGAHSFSDFISRVMVFGQIAAAAAREVDLIHQQEQAEQAEKAALAKQEQSLNITRQSLAAHANLLNQEEAALTAAQQHAVALEAEASQAAAAASAQMAQENALMARLRQQQAALQQQMAALASEIDRIAAQLDSLLSQYNQGYLSRRALYDAMLPLVQPIAAKFGLPPALVIAVITEESGGNQSARSVTGAIGLMQLEPGTAAELGIDPYNPEQNVLGGCLYLHQMLQLFNGNLSLALSAYNAGPGAVEANHNQVLPYTQQYVDNVEALYHLYQTY